MRKIAILFLFALCTCAASGKPLRDGALLNGVDGILSKSPDSNNWLFTFRTTIADDKGSIKEGQSVEVFQSSTLANMVSIMKDSQASFRLWATVTQFEGRNYIYPVYFLTLTEQQRQQDANAAAVQKPIFINEPNDVVKIPEEVLKKLKPERTVELTQLSPTAGLEEDRVFSDRSGFINKTSGGTYLFKPDALGRNVQKISFPILPNDVLQQTMDLESHNPERLRFKVTGILTTYNGKDYILLQRAARQYSYGNFAR